MAGLPTKSAAFLNPRMGKQVVQCKYRSDFVWIDKDMYADLQSTSAVRNFTTIWGLQSIEVRHFILFQMVVRVIKSKSSSSQNHLI